MYVPDTLERLNEEAAAAYRGMAHLSEEDQDNAAAALDGATDDEKAAVMERYGLSECDYCDEPAARVLEFRNPADELNGVDGVYSVVPVCEDCEDAAMQDAFYCDDCGRLFIVNHSWDVLAVSDSSTGEMFCQQCYVDNHMAGVDGVALVEKLRCADTDDFVRLDGLPNHALLWSDGFSQYSGFNGKSLGDVADEVETALEESGATEVIPVITFTGQFHVNLAVYLA